MANLAISITCQEFGVEFTNTNMRGYIQTPIKVFVESAISGKTFMVNMKRGVGTNKAILSGGWAKATKRYRMEEGHIYIFSSVNSVILSAS